MIERKDFDGKPYAEMVSAIEADLVMYTEEVAGYETLEQCVAAEQELMEKIKELEENLNAVKYELPKDVHFDGKRYSKNEVATKIIYFLNKLELKWSYTQGMKELVDLWRSEDFTEISYRVYDSTLRTLDQVTYKGYTEWNDILIINEYLSGCHNVYSLDTGSLVYLSERHNILMNRMKMLDPTNVEIPEELN
jgi:hypothetical protein